MCPKRFSGKFGEIRAKSIRIPKHLLAPTPMAMLNSPKKSSEFDKFIREMG